MNLLLTLQLACTPDPVPTDDSVPTIPTCAAVDSVALTLPVEPGATVSVAAVGDGAAEAIWVVSAGSLDLDVGATVAWTLPTDLARYDAELVEITAGTACQTEPARLDVEVDWPEAARVVVLYNPEVPGSEAVADAYASFRSLPTANRCGVAATDSTNLSGAEFSTWGRAVLDCVHAAGPHISTIVPVYGVPYRLGDRIDDLFYATKATVSVDSVLSWGEAGLTATEPEPHPLYIRGSSIDQRYGTWKPFGQWRANHPDEEFYLVTRIDGESSDAAIALIERTRLAEATVLSGVVYVDGNQGDTPPATDNFGSYESGEWNMWGTRDVFETVGLYPVVWDGHSEEFGTAPAPLECPDALYYAGWYSFYHYNDAFTWAVGAIGGHLDSCSACDLRAGTWSAEALRRGITATFGAVSEPYVAGMPEYDQFFAFLLQGASFGEAAYESTVYGKWMMVWVGDPLYRPYRVAND